MTPSIATESPSAKTELAPAREPVYRPQSRAYRPWKNELQKQRVRPIEPSSAIESNDAANSAGQPAPAKETP
jgi:hypothetical protein